jgi:hypothetical protein
MASNPGSTNGGTPSSGEPYTFLSFGNFGPPYVATLSLPGLTIGLPVWLFPTPVIPNPPNVSVAPNTLDVNAPPTHQPHVDFSPSSPIKFPSISPSSSSDYELVTLVTIIFRVLHKVMVIGSLTVPG